MTGDLKVPAGSEEGWKATVVTAKAVALTAYELLTNPATDAAEAFLRFLTSSPVQARFRQQGYEVPDR